MSGSLLRVVFGVGSSTNSRVFALEDLAECGGLLRSVRK